MGGGGGLGLLLTFLPILLIFYFLLWMPMQRQKKRQQQMISSLATGQTVLTSGGIVGTIISLSSEDDTLVVRVKPDNVKLQIARSAVAGLVSTEPKTEIKK